MLSLFVGVLAFAAGIWVGSKYGTKIEAEIEKVTDIDDSRA